ncbi:MAG: beta-mannosidase [Solirubrobacteraceae bacterium]|nr:beta-mannosidase [Solirubrobacteraceae bacterium]
MLAPASLARTGGHDVRWLSDGWEAAATPPDACADPAAIERLDWLRARVPGTAAGALRDAGIDSPGDLDAQDWWFRTRFHADGAQDGEQVLLHLDGIATVADVYLNGVRVLASDSMFAAHAIDVGARLAGANELAIRCRALTPLLGVRRKPRARWRTKLASSGELRWFRTMLLGRAPGFAAGPAAVGPWRPVWLERRRVAVSELTLRSRLDGDDGVLAVRVCLGAPGGAATTAIVVEADGPSGRHAVALELARDGDEVVGRGELRIASVARWWPHTHGDPALHDVRLTVTCASDVHVVEAGRAGFRSLTAGARADHDVAADGLALHVNDVAIFARGALWTPLDAVGLAPGPGELRAALQTVRDAGMNMLRIPGTSAYEQPAFYDLCDELGILVWQDLMFANLDYPFADAAFRETAEREATQLLASLAGRPCLSVLCGNSEIEQQVAMLGLGPELGRGEFFGATLPALVAAAQSDAVYVPSAPSGGDLPFRPDHGVANYYGVGGYRRPLSDARAAGVRFAAECLAFANVPDAEALDVLAAHAPGGVVVHHPSWKAGVPRDAGAGWDFDDIRDHYLAQLYGVDPVALRSVDHERYLELSRAVTGEVMAEVLGEWRRTASPCGGALVLWLRDLAPGAGWGVLDHTGEPKVAYHHLRRALAPVAVWTTDEGLGGVAVHVANDGPDVLSARLRLALYRDLEQQVGEVVEPLELPAHGAYEGNVESLLGYFVDAAWAYRFGPPAQDLIVASLEREVDGAPQLLAQSVRFPAGRPAAAQPLSRIGLEASATLLPGGSVRLSACTRQLAYGVRVHVPGFAPADDAFALEPGVTRSVLLTPRDPGATFTGGALTALNLQGRVRIATPGEPA